MPEQPQRLIFSDETACTSAANATATSASYAAVGLGVAGASGVAGANAVALFRSRPVPPGQ
jgi:hypothetical protein